MGALVVLLIGVAIVIGGVLVLRMHAFVALVLAALVVALLTPREAVVRQSLLSQASQRKIAIDSVAEDGRTLTISAPSAGPFTPPADFVIVRPGSDPWRFSLVGSVLLNEPPATPANGPAHVTASADLEDGIDAALPQDVVLPRHVYDSAIAAGKVIAPERVAAGFGSTAASIGILIAFASIIGKCLLDSGAADRVVRSALRLTGEAGAPKAFVASGFLLGIPVFFDTVFYLMLPLGKALRLRTGRNYLLYVLSIVAGATMAHSLVPPTPGPLFIAGEFGVGMGLMILVGCAVGAGTSLSGYLWALWINRRVDLPLRDTADTSAAVLEKAAQREEAELPPLWLSLAPIILPVVLMVGREVLKVLQDEKLWRTPPPVLIQTADLLGNKNVALMLAAAVAIGTLVWQRRTSLKELSQSLQSALAGAGLIILITSAGGAFGKAIEQTGVATLIGQLPVQSTPAILTLAFLITVAVRTAQGSATVAMITAAGIFAPIATSSDLAFHPVWLAMAVGCGSKAIAWMNDSGFWVITQMSGMTEAEGLKYVTPMMIVMAIVGLVLTIAGALFVPLA